ncbi:MAG TPA: hypothetical protein VL986_11675 [Terracidiphilus sp.]|nr:hypothetical protein [Terracidiphilus sp.]
MKRIRDLLAMAGLTTAAMIAVAARAQPPANAPIPNIPDLMKRVMDHQKELEKVRENYTFTSEQKTEDMDANGHVTKTETQENDDFFVNGHLIERTVKKDGKQLSDRDEQKETEHVTKLVEKAQKTPPDQPLEGQTISVSRLLDIMDVRNPHRETYRGRPTIVFDFIGRRNAKTHGLAEDVSKKLQGTMWVDEAGLQVVHLEVSFNDKFRVGGGLVATVDKGSSFRFDQAQVENGLWLPTGSEAMLQGKLLMVKSLHEHIVERDYDFKVFRVETQQSKEAKVATPAKP